MLKIKKIVNLILLGTIFHIIFSFEITPYAIYKYNSDSNLYPYENKYEIYSKLCFELQRSIRLVLDTGINIFKWSYKKSYDYYKHNIANCPDLSKSNYLISIH